MTDEKEQRFAMCNACGWRGPATDLKEDPASPILELCPVCGSEDTWWLTAEEYIRGNEI